MKNRKLTEADVTSESVFMLQRRQILKMLGISATALTLSPAAHADLLDWFKGNDRPKAPSGAPLTFTKPAQWQNKLTLTPEDKVTGYNNFYEFGLDKADPAANAGRLGRLASGAPAASSRGAAPTRSTRSSAFGTSASSSFTLMA